MSFLLTYKMRDDHPCDNDSEEDFETLESATKAMNELMDGMVLFASITDEDGNEVGSR